jgi:hypothetical protein
VIRHSGYPDLSPPDLDPVLTQARRLAPDLLTDDLRDALAWQDHIQAANVDAYRRHLNITWLRDVDRGVEHDL